MVLPSASLLGDLGATAACEVLSCVRPFSSLIRSHVQNHGPHVGIITWAGAREIERAEPWSTCGHHHLGWGQGDRMCRTMVHTWASSPGLGPGRSHVPNHGPHVGIITWAGAREIARAEPWSTRGYHHLGWGQGDRSAEPWSTRGHRHLGWGQGSLATAVVIVQTGKQVGRAENGSESLQGVHTCRAGV